MVQILSVSLLIRSGGRQHNEAVFSNGSDWADSSSGDFAGGLKLGAELGAIDSLKPSVYQLKRRAEPTALRSLERFENDKDALLALAETHFKGLTWAEPGVDLDARLTALREAVYIRLGEWGGEG